MFGILAFGISDISFLPKTNISFTVIKDGVQFTSTQNSIYTINPFTLFNKHNRGYNWFCNVKMYFKIKLWNIQFVGFILLKTSKLSHSSSWILLNSLLESPLYFLIKCLLLWLDFLNTYKRNLWLMTVRTYWTWRTNACFTS